jgi:hypothetical protein
MSILSGVVGNLFGSLKGQLISLILSYLPEITDLIKDELEALIQKWYADSGDTPKMWDDLLFSFCLDVINFGDESHKKVFPQEFKEGMYVLYYKTKNTPNPYDDIVVAALFKLMGLETPAS